MLIEFVKMHGLGNDFVIVRRSAELADLDEKSLAIAISDRRIGIGCDQFIIYEKDDSKPGYYNMSIYNQDGSSAEACGNGTRCLVKLIGQDTITIKVLDRILNASLLQDGNVTVNMGKVSFHEKWMPTDEIIWEIASQYKLEPKEMVCADIGNPHLVIFNSTLSDKDRMLLGQMLEHHEAFSNGVNVNFAKIGSNGIHLEVWERGDGFTLACGSGACATFAAAKRLGFASDESLVHFKLGSLSMKMNKESILMTGPARMVARGHYVYSAS